MWPFSPPTSTAERHAATDAARAATATELADAAVEAQRVADETLASARAASADRDRASAAQREQEAADLLVKQRAEFEAARKTVSVAGIIDEIGPEIAEIVALNKQLRPIVARIEAKVSAWNTRARGCEVLGRAVGEFYATPSFDYMNARAIVNAALGEAFQGAASLHEWLFARKR